MVGLSSVSRFDLGPMMAGGVSVLVPIAAGSGADADPDPCAEAGIRAYCGACGAA